MSSDWDETALSHPGDHDLDGAEPKAFLVVVRGNKIGRSFPVNGPEMTIGRAAGSDVRLEDDGVSRFHCKLRQHDGRVVVEDLDSRNGTFCNGERVAQGSRSLEEGDRLQIGTTTVLLFTYAEADLTATPDPVNESGLQDQLTGAFSRRYFIDRLETDVMHALRTKAQLSLLLVHIDRYAEIYRSHGEELIHQVTAEVATRLRKQIRDTDVLARIDGGDFALIRYSASPGDVFMLSERLRKSSAGLTVPVGDQAQAVTLSLGAASLHELRVDSGLSFLLAAGNALDRARGKGGNRSVLCTQDLLQESRTRTKV